MKSPVGFSLKEKVVTCHSVTKKQTKGVFASWPLFFTMGSFCWFVLVFFPFKEENFIETAKFVVLLNTFLVHF